MKAKTCLNQQAKCLVSGKILQKQGNSYSVCVLGVGWCSQYHGQLLSASYWENVGYPGQLQSLQITVLTGLWLERLVERNPAPVFLGSESIKSHWRMTMSVLYSWEWVKGLVGLLGSQQADWDFHGLDSPPLASTSSRAQTTICAARGPNQVPLSEDLGT